MISFLTRKLGGNFHSDIFKAEKNLSSEAKQLISEAYQGLEGQTLVDYHVHLLGLGSNGNGCFVSEELQSWKHPIKRLQFGR